MFAPGIIDLYASKSGLEIVKDNVEDELLRDYMSTYYDVEQDQGYVSTDFFEDMWELVKRGIQRKLYEPEELFETQNGLYEWLYNRIIDDLDNIVKYYNVHFNTRYFIKDC